MKSGMRSRFIDGKLVLIKFSNLPESDYEFLFRR